eukprot:CAMPEP_0197593832 /NCGR_PEP_ID=MMETSP1326-20131121/19148_1 /TAXON_ID=1155430 /ORGANISM="Genus nov. species nov., Strain RCC2288" /LENGTH=189 /DNA_ID=CAMNT_0043159883 /DNA_START=50 /DNA_END=619 /DNA_ORIENTATION=+
MFSAVAASAATARPVVSKGSRGSDAVRCRSNTSHVAPAGMMRGSVCGGVVSGVRPAVGAMMAVVCSSRSIRGARVVVRAEGGDGGKEVEDLPPWERREIEKKAAMEKGGLPWPLFLVFSAIVGIASVGSCFELTYGNAIFGVIGPDNFLYKPILYWLIGTGFPLTVYMYVQGIKGANEAADLQDKMDGF